MATEKDYQTLIAGYDATTLLSFWEKVKAGETPGWAAGKAFEYLILRAFQLEGAHVVWPYSVRDLAGKELEQIDGAIFTEGLSFLVEAKDYSADLDIEPIAKLRNQLIRRPSRVLGLVFSRKGFTSPAVTLARYITPQNVLLWQGEEIDNALSKKMMIRGLVEKFRHAVTHGWPDFNIQSLEAASS
jgi:hypothetical protein